MGKQKVDPRVRRFLARIGRRGGKARAGRSSQGDLDSTARRAAFLRWMRQKFNVEQFEEMGLPGAEIVDAGLRQLVAGEREQVEALVVAELRPRLQYLGVPVPEVARDIDEPRTRLYRLLEERYGGMAHQRILALLERADSFCDSLASVSPVRPQRRIRRERAWCR